MTWLILCAAACCIFLLGVIIGAVLTNGKDDDTFDEFNDQ